MTTNEAKNLILQNGEHKGKRLSEVPLTYLKWMAKNWVKKEMRDAAIKVVNQRSLDLGVEIQYQPTYKPLSNPKLLERPVTKGPMGSLEELLRNTPQNLF